MTIEVAGCHGWTWLKPPLSSASITDVIEHIQQPSPGAVSEGRMRAWDPAPAPCSPKALCSAAPHLPGRITQGESWAVQLLWKTREQKHQWHWGQPLISGSCCPQSILFRETTLKESKKALSFAGPFDFITCHSIKCSFQNLWDLKYYGHTTLD